MNNEKYITINATIQKKKGLTQLPEPIHVVIICKKEHAISMFSDKKFAKKLVTGERNLGNKSIKYDKKLNVAIQKYKGLSAKEVATKIGKELKKAGGTLN